MPYFAIRFTINFDMGSGTVIKDEMGLTLEEASKEVLGSAAKVVISKDSTLIVTNGSTQHLVEKRVSQLRNLSEVHNYKNLCFCRAIKFQILESVI